jgi:hypothetical protein
MKRHHDAFTANSWDHKLLEPEARVCLILNRFTRNLTVMYASSACEKVFHVDPNDIAGKPILLYIRADDLAPFVEQVDLIKSSASISQMRFWFQSPNWPREIPCEAIVFASADGIVAVVRRCKPFVRKHLIGSREQFEIRNQSSTWSCFRNQSYGLSPGSELSTPPCSPPTFGTYGSILATSYRNVSRGTLDRIRILELDDEKSRLISNLPEDDPYLIHEKAAASEVPAFKEMIVQHYQEDGDDDEDDDADAADDDDDVDMVVRGVAINRLENDGAGF